MFEEMLRKNVSKKDEDFFFIGQKTAMNYVLACVSLLNRGVGEVALKARGKSHR